MYIVLLEFIASAIAIVFCSKYLVKHAEVISHKLNIQGWIIGSLLLASVTSLPELVVDIKAIKQNLPDIAIGDLLGSSLYNILIILNCILYFGTSKARSIVNVSFNNKLIFFSITMASVVTVGLCIRETIQIFSISVSAWILLFSYLGYYFMALVKVSQPVINMPLSIKVPIKVDRDLLLSLLGFALTALGIYFSAPFLLGSLDRISIEFNLEHTFLGTTLLALITSLPELATTITAFRIGNFELAVGNIFGSNAFNMLLFLPLDAMTNNVLFSEGSRIHIVTSISAVVISIIFLMLEVFKFKLRVQYYYLGVRFSIILIILVIYLVFKMSSGVL